MCTRAFNNHAGSIFTTGRNMDWAQPMDTNLYAFGSGLQRSGLPAGDDSGCAPAQWKSDYASVVAMVGGESTADGINSEGLVGNVLYLAGSRYANPEKRKNAECLSVLRWVQYVLDNFATVAGVVKEIQDNEAPTLVGAQVPDESSDPKEAELHLSISDRHGDSAIIEVFDGKYHVMTSPEYRVMTNDPRFEKQLQLNAYWRWQWDTVNNTHPTFTLPGSTYSPDRFARADYFVNNLERMTNDVNAVAQMFSIIRNAAVPLGYQPAEKDGADEPNIAQTLWSTVAAHDSLRYYFGDVATPNIYWADLKDRTAFPGGLKEGSSLFLPNKHKNGAPIYYAGCTNNEFLATTDPFAG